MVRFALQLSMLGLLAGCAAGERTLPGPSPSSTIPDGHARIIVTRTSDALFLGLPADITVNDQRAGSIWRGETTTADVPAGQTAVAVTAFGAPGRSVVRVPTVTGGRYTLEVAPRGSSAVPFIALGYLGSMLDGAASGEQGGTFSLTITSATPPIGTAATTATSAPAPALSAEDRERRLAELRRLRDRGLITEDIYREEQRRALAR